jgi:hypothetical protein
MKRRLTCLAAVALVGAGSAAAPTASLASVAMGPQWVIQLPPNPAVPDNNFQGVSCTSGTACTAVGSSGPLMFGPAGDPGRPFAAKAQRLAAATVNTRTLAERWNGTHWSIEKTANPAGSSFSTLAAVSCTSRRACTSVGSSLAGKVTVPLAERWNGSRWSIESTPRPPKAEHSALAGVSCPTSNECIAVGTYGTTPSAAFGFAERWDGSRWTLAGVVRAGVQAFLASVSCSSGLNCTAVGAYEIKNTGLAPDLPLAERLVGGRWRKQPTPGKGVLVGVSCPAFSECIAVGSQPNPSLGKTDTMVLAMRWSAGKWRKQATPVLSGSTLGFLIGLSCTTVTSCTAAGWVDLTTAVTAIASWNGTRWTLNLTPNPAKSISTSFTSISCGVHFECRAAGSYETPSFTVKTLIERG